MALLLLDTEAPTAEASTPVAGHAAGTVTAESTLHEQLVTDLGGDPQKLAHFRPQPTTQAYNSYILATAYGDDFAEELAVIIGFPGWIPRPSARGGRSSCRSAWLIRLCRWWFVFSGCVPVPVVSDARSGCCAAWALRACAVRVEPCGGAAFLVDAAGLWHLLRNPEILTAWEGSIAAGALRVCEPTRTEFLYSATGPAHRDELADELDTLAKMAAVPPSTTI